MIKAVISDLDGVLLDSLSAHYEASRASYSEVYGRVLNTSLEEYKRVISLPSGFKGGYGALGFVYERDKSIIGRNFEFFINSDCVTFFPGVIDLFKSFECRKGLVTSSTRDIVERKFKGLDGLFDFIVCYHEAGRLKPEPDGLLLCASWLGVLPSEAIYVGDSVTDGVAARSAGMRFVGVSYGYNTREVLECLPNEGIACSVQELGVIINGLLRQ